MSIFVIRKVRTKYSFLNLVTHLAPRIWEQVRKAKNGIVIYQEKLKTDEILRH